MLFRSAKEQGPEESTWDFSLLRDLKPIAPRAVAGWRPMTAEERKKVEQVGNRYLLRAGSVHLGPEQIELALHRGYSAARQRAGKQHLELSLVVTAIYPEAKLVDADAKLIGVKRPSNSFAPRCAPSRNDKSSRRCAPRAGSAIFYGPSPR